MARVIALALMLAGCGGALESPQPGALAVEWSGIVSPGCDSARVIEYRLEASDCLTVTHQVPVTWPGGTMFASVDRGTCNGAPATVSLGEGNWKTFLTALELPFPLPAEVDMAVLKLEHEWYGCEAAVSLTWELVDSRTWEP